MPRAHGLLSLLLLLLLLLLLPSADAESAPSAFLRVDLPNAGVYQAAAAEVALSTELQVQLPSLSARCVEMTEVSSPSSSSALSFSLLFLVGANPFTSETVSDTLPLDLPSLQSALALLFPSSPPSIWLLSTAEAVDAFGWLPSLRPIAASPPSAFLSVEVLYRNLPSPANLTQSLLFQTRRGLQRFLSLASPAQVVATGPPTVPSSSVLLLSQTFLLLLNNNHSDATSDNRERLANLLRYGDPARLVGDEASSLRPSLFIDYAVASGEDVGVEPTILPSLPYVFSSVVVDPLPSGNPPPPEAEQPPGTVLLPATPTDQLLSRIRRRHRFQFNNDPSSSSSAPPSACPTEGMCLRLHWQNDVPSTAFWLESVESLTALTWNLSPSSPLCSSMKTPTPLLPSQVIEEGNATLPWTLSPLLSSPPSSALAFALNLRSVDDNSTRLKIEISADVRSPVQAASSVTSIARHVPSSSPSPSQPVYNTKSNVVVSYDSQFLPSSNEIALLLRLHPSALVEKDTSQPCAHCQTLFDYCASHSACLTLSNCVLRDGLEAEQVPSTLLQAPSLLDAVADVSPVLRRCLPSPSSSASLDSLLLFTSALRCQLQRMCPFRRPINYGLTGIDDRLLLWEATSGVLRLSLPSSSSSEGTATLRLGSTTLCSFSSEALISTSQKLEDWIPRQCQFSSYLGHVTVNVTSSSTETEVELRFQNLVGPMPTLEFSSSSTSSIAAIVVALPSIYLRADLADFATALPPAPPSPPLVSECSSRCRRLALDGCLRDLECVAFTDCIARYAPVTSPGGTIGDDMLAFFERESVGETLEFSEALAACVPSAPLVLSPAWAKLVAASACLAKHDCPISLRGTLLPVLSAPSAASAKWRISPVTQRLIYVHPSTEPAATEIPLLLQTTSSAVPSPCALDAVALQSALQSLLSHEDVAVNLASEEEGVLQWDIEYTHWLGPPPQFIAEELSPTWRLVTLPSSSDPRSFRLEMVEPTVNTSSSSNSTTYAVEYVAPLL